MGGITYCTHRIHVVAQFLGSAMHSRAIRIATYLLVTGFLTVQLVDILSMNLGWVQLAKAISHPTVDSSQLANAKRNFERAKAGQPGRAGLGLGTAEIWDGRSDEAIKAWCHGNVSADWLLAMGTTKYGLGDLNGALAYFVGAEELAEGGNNEARISAGLVCQQTYSEPDLLSDNAQDFCRGFFAEQGHNLIVNGNLHSGSASGWRKSIVAQQEPFAYGVDADQGRMAPSMRMTLQNPHGNLGLVQRINVIPGTTLRFRATVRTEVTDSRFEARVLNVQFSRDGKSPGNALLTLSETTDWTTYEHLFQLPLDADGQVSFFPVLAKGEGIIWFDNVSVTVVSEPR